jgi:hypothetical protein
VTGPISRNRLLGSLKEAASWPGADRSTVVTLATALVAARADAEGSSYFQDLSDWSAVMTSSPGSITSAPDTGSPTDRGSTRGAQKKQRRSSTC